MNSILKLCGFFVNLFEKIAFRIQIYFEKRINTLCLLAYRSRNNAKTVIGKNVRIGFGCQWEVGKNSTLIIGDNVTIRHNCLIALKDNATIIIGNNTYIGPYSELFVRQKLEIGSSTLIAQRVLIIDYNHKWDKMDGVRRTEFISAPITIGSECWLAAQVIVLAGSIIEDSVLVGAGVKVRGRVSVGEKKVE